MIEVYPHLWVGSDQDYQVIWNDPDWYFLQAAKEPHHRDALRYKGRSALNTDPEYLYAYRNHRLILNMVDADDPKYFPHEMIEAALDFLDDTLVAKRQKVLVHCNKGESRAPSLTMLYLATRIHSLPQPSFAMAETIFMRQYPAYAPKEGIRKYLQQNWDRYRWVVK